MNYTNIADLAENYLNYLKEIFQKDPLIFTNQTLTDGLPGVISMVFEDIPEPGYLTACTYGLSLFDNPNWIKGRPELCISVESNDINWGKAIGGIANFYRDHQAFSYGQVFDGEIQVSSESLMTAFFVFAPAILPPESYLNIDIGASYKINIAGLYPIHKQEMDVINEIGLKDFFHDRGFDAYDVKRPPVNLGR